MAKKIWSQLTKEEIIAEAAKYKTRKDFERGCASAYKAAKAMDIYEEACSHMKTTTRWSPEAVAELASQCKTKN